MEKWGRRRCRRPFPLPATPHRPYQRKALIRIKLDGRAAGTVYRRGERRPPCRHGGTVSPLLSPRTCSGVQARPPDTDPGKAGRERYLTGWTPEQVRGDKRGVRAGGASVPQSEPRPDRCAGNPRITGPYARSAKVKPDSSGTSPGMTEERKKRRGPPVRRAIRTSQERNAAGLAPAHVEDTIMHATAIVTDAAVTRSGPPTALPVTEGFRDEHRCEMPTRGSNMPTPWHRARTVGICRRQCRPAGRVGKGRHSRSASAGRECRPGRDLSTRLTNIVYPPGGRIIGAGPHGNGSRDGR